MTSPNANLYAQSGPSSEVVLSFAGESQPPSYSQVQETSVIRPGKYVFRDIQTLTEPVTTTVVVSEEGSAPPIYHIINKKLPMISTHLVTIRKGPPEFRGKILATFELQGRDMIIVDSKTEELSKVFSYTKALSGPESFNASLGNRHRWARDLSDHARRNERRLLCRPNPGPRDPPAWARFSYADPMHAVWQPEMYLAEHQFEVFPEGIRFVDECLLSLVVLLLVRPEVVEKMFKFAV
ncbi:hypothetical protein DL96DRAFT_1631482 [Flagelloscypha sp. PMI_526]|nr:hypothetical protein DL96DRAFT_1631482 [Flagelloscypha sp. PMI_526]